jgi:hypothetical protein
MRLPVPPAGPRVPREHDSSSQRIEPERGDSATLHQSMLSSRRALAVMALAMTACGPRGGTDVGNGATVSFDLSGYEAKTPIDTTDATGSQKQAITLTTGDTVDEVWIAVERFQLQPGATCSGADTTATTYDGPLIVNLLDGNPMASDKIAIQSGSYCRLRLELHEVDATELPAGAPQELAGASLLMRGHRADGVPFTVRSRQHVEFRLDAGSGGAFVLEGDNPLIVGFELGSMVRALDLGPLGTLPIVIDDKTNVDRLNGLDKALRSAATLFRDEDEDGELGEDESAPGKEIAEGQL